MYYIKFLFKILCYSLYDIIKIFINLRKDYNFIIIYPRALCFIFKNVLIFEKKNNKFFIQYVRNYSDILTVYEIFSEEHYNLKKFEIFSNIIKYLEKEEKIKNSLILDCGSNIGSSSRYFSKLFKNSKIVSIEPDYESFVFSKKNIELNKSEIINSAISNENEKVGFHSDKQDNRASRINEKSDFKIQCIKVENIIEKFDERNFFPFLIKIDIEGYENKLFKSNYEWINEFKVIIIEIHDWMMPNKSNSYTFLKALNDITQKFNKRDFLISGENLISIRIDEK